MAHAQWPAPSTPNIKDIAPGELPACPRLRAESYPSDTIKTLLPGHTTLPENRSYTGLAPFCETFLWRHQELHQNSLLVRCKGHRCYSLESSWDLRKAQP